MAVSGLVLVLFGSGVEAALPLRKPPRRFAEAAPSPGQQSGRPVRGAASPVSAFSVTLKMRVRDENGAVVPQASVRLLASDGRSLRGETDYSGRLEFAGVQTGTYQLVVEKAGYYLLKEQGIQVSEDRELEVTVSHIQELSESVSVFYTPPLIRSAETTSSRQLTSSEIVNLPFPTTRDIRNAFPMVPGVVADSTGQVHVEGAATYQTVDRLDGFEIRDPVDGLFNLRLSADAVRSIDISSSRYSAATGRGSGGIIDLATASGDDQYRFSATNFIPDLQTRRGLSVKNWTPRFSFSGPIRKGNAWFFDSVDLEFSQNVFEELPVGADRSHSLRWSNLGKIQLNWGESNILRSSFLVNWFHAPRAGLSSFDPLETTRNRRQRAYLYTLENQSYLSNRILLDVGIGMSWFRTSEVPRGTETYILTPEGSKGNYFQTSKRGSSRLEFFTRLTLPPLSGRGRHEIHLGIDAERVTYHQFFGRGETEILREDGTLARRVSFYGPLDFRKNNVEVGGFLQDRWNLSEKTFFNLGVRADWDRIFGKLLIAPRLALSRMLTADGKTKLTAGVGLYYDGTNLALVSRPLLGRRTDQFFGREGKDPLQDPVVTAYRAQPSRLDQARFWNWSLALERRLAASTFLRAEFLEKRGREGLAYDPEITVRDGQVENLLQLGNGRRDRYDSLHLSLRHVFKNIYPIFLSYTRSSARSNEVIDYDPQNLTFSQQMPGTLPWDVPNRLLLKGWYPALGHFQVSYLLEWRSGFPFSVVDQEQRLVGTPNGRRFPDYFSLNLHAERRFHLWGRLIAIRAGFENITDRHNPDSVINNIDSGRFLTFGSIQGRAFTGRIRLLGHR